MHVPFDSVTPLLELYLKDTRETTGRYMHKTLHLAQCVIAKTVNKPNVYKQRIGWTVCGTCLQQNTIQLSKRAIKISINCYGVIPRTYTDTHTQLTLEQHRFELQKFTYPWIFFHSNTIVILWLTELEDAEPWIERIHGYGGPSVNYRQTMPKVGTPNLMLFRDQL